MPDQAQGLRALVNQARRDQHNGSTVLDACDVPGSASTHETSYGLSLSHSAQPRDTEPAAADVFLPESRPANAVVMTPPANAVVTAPPAGDIFRTSASDAFRAPTGARAGKVARVVAVTSGKGGVGKTNFSTNLSVFLAARETNVIVVDADLGLANLHVVCGVTPKYHLEHVMRGERSLSEILWPGPNGIRMIAGASGLAELANLDEDRRSVFIEALHELDQLADLIMIDTGAGLSRNVMAFLCAVEEVIIVTTPEPTAITDAYATIKVLTQENPEANLLLVVNMAQSSTEADAVASRLKSIAQRFLQRDLTYLGYVPQDPAVSRAVRAQQPFVLAYPHSRAADAIGAIAARFTVDKRLAPPKRGVTGMIARLQRYFGFGRSSKVSSIVEENAA
jgi:flagellar biosynthesis protein FlhG